MKISELCYYMRYLKCIYSVSFVVVVFSIYQKKNVYFFCMFTSIDIKKTNFPTNNFFIYLISILYKEWVLIKIFSHKKRKNKIEV